MRGSEARSSALARFSALQAARHYPQKRSPRGRVGSPKHREALTSPVRRSARLRSSGWPSSPKPGTSPIWHGVAVAVVAAHSSGWLTPGHGRRPPSLLASDDRHNASSIITRSSIAQLACSLAAAQMPTRMMIELRRLQFSHVHGDQRRRPPFHRKRKLAVELRRSIDARCI